MQYFNVATSHVYFQNLSTFTIMCFEVKVFKTLGNLKIATTTRNG